MRNRKGIALIMAVGILALLAVIATSFALNMRLEYKAAMNYYNGVKARYLAEAAIQRAIANLREHVKSSAFDYFDDEDELWAESPAYVDDISGDGTNDAVSTSIVDEQRKININNANSTLLGNLCDIRGISADLRTALIGEIGDFSQREGLKRVILENDGTEADYETLEPYITVHSYEDRSINRSPINLNTCESVVLESVLRGLSEGSGNTISNFEAEDVATAIINARPITSWSEFDSVIDSSASGGDIDVIRNNCNPNRTSPATSTTEFCFNSGGVYEISGAGTVADSGGNPIATRTVTAIVKIYAIYNQTTAVDFEQGEQNKVTWLDSCPVNSDALFGDPASLADAETVSGSIKLGFWDDFNEDGDRGDYKDEPWSPLNIANKDIADNDWELYTQNNAKARLYGSGLGAEWSWSDFALRVSAYEYDTTTASQMKDVAWILFRSPYGEIAENTIPAVLHTRTAPLSWSAATDEEYAYSIPTGLPGEIDFYTAADAVANLEFADEAEALSKRHRYDVGGGQVRIFTRYRNRDPHETDPFEFEHENYDNSVYKSDLTYSERKTFNIITGNYWADPSEDPKNVTVDVWTDSSSASYARNITEEETDSGMMVLYGNDIDVAWDDIRIISGWGQYVSREINSTIIPELNEGVNWGTITATITLPPESTWEATDKFRWRFRTTVDDGGDWEVAYPPTSGNPKDILVLNCSDETLYLYLDSDDELNPIDSAEAHLSFDDSPLFAGNGTAPLKFRVRLETTNLTRTPILEDITITYLPKVEFLSWVIE